MVRVGTGFFFNLHYISYNSYLYVGAGLPNVNGIPVIVIESSLPVSNRESLQ